MKNINAIRMLSIDMINKANSGHPGIAMGAAPMMETLWSKVLRVNPQKSNWQNRDRFILPLEKDISFFTNIIDDSIKFFV